MISNKSFVDAASKLGCEVAAIKAIASVETKGSAWISPGVPQILYERHIMARLLKAKGISLVGLPSDLVNTVPGGYGKFSEQHGKLDRAVKIDRECALQSCSWGMFQLMGFNYKACGYDTVQKFVNAMYKSEDEQLNAFVGFIKSNLQLNDALKSKDWPTVARLYNGADYKINSYDQKLVEAYDRFK